ncbi:LSU ribosomal protein L29P [Synechococcus elongatus PCC 6311]|nr:LSU ribosomal protein L29P [Synechococcus elongatus PCC 6311]UOW77491.1 LSU ribosomal protein L29P [Synechococcus elongatus PCC 6301]
MRTCGISVTPTLLKRLPKPNGNCLISVFNGPPGSLKSPIFSNTPNIVWLSCSPLNVSANRVGII